MVFIYNILPVTIFGYNIIKVCVSYSEMVFIYTIVYLLQYLDTILLKFVYHILRFFFLDEMLVFHIRNEISSI